ncbi:MAG TPA: YtcA family lipoprotein [Paenalcaligenes sp.]|nr:YtcA family lipoprotein [Paenalcaligenes sp.]
MIAKLKINTTHIMSPRLSFLPLFFLLSGCQYSPSIYIAGSYFPAWLVCVAISIPITIALRVLLIAVGIDDYLPMRLLTYICFALLISLAALWILFD